MSVEAPRPQGEQGRDSLQETRGLFNRELLGREYTRGALLTRTLQLQNALLQSGLSPEKIYHELTIVAGQGADRAEIHDDADTALTLREMQRGFELTYETFKPKMEQAEAAARSARPMHPESYPPMIGAKGEMRSQVQTPEVATATPEGQTTTEAETPQQPQRGRGRPPKSP